MGLEARAALDGRPSERPEAGKGAEGAWLDASALLVRLGGEEPGDGEQGMGHGCQLEPPERDGDVGTGALKGERGEGGPDAQRALGRLDVAGSDDDIGGAGLGGWTVDADDLARGELRD